MRVMSVSALFARVVFRARAVFEPEADANGNGLYITTLFVATAFAPKSVQRLAERLSENE